MRFVRAIFMLGAAAAMPALGNLPTWDSSGNSLLNGTYYFREVVYVVSDTSGDLSAAAAIYGNMTFNGAGGYSIPANSAIFQQSGSSGGYLPAVSGAYTVAASGQGFFPAPLVSGAQVYGMVSNGVFIGSMTETGYVDLFIAAPVSAPVATNSSFQGAYTFAGFVPGGTPATMADTTFQLNPDGNGNLGTVNVTGYFGGGGSTIYTQSNGGLKYNFVNGAGIITFPTSSTANFYSGQEYMYISPDRNFVFGGSPGGFDMFVGVKNSTATVNFSGLYYQAGIDNDTSQLASSGYGAIDNYYGSFNASAGTAIGHQRLNTPLYNSVTEGFTYASTYPTTISGAAYTDSVSQTQYTFANGGAVRIGFGIGPYLGISVALQAPALSGTGVYLNPTGVVNAASFSPFTAGVSPGEFIVLYGTGLSSGNAVASSLPFPTTLGNVQVKINGITAPIYYVTPTQLAVIVPYGAAYTAASGTLPIAQIQVINNGISSNVTTQFINLTTPGIFTLTANGIGYGAIEHATTGQVVNAKSPAQPGETVAVFVSGLGATLPSVTEGTAGPTNPLAATIQTIVAYVGGIEATVGYAGLAPYLAGLYQINLTVPTTVTAGDNNVEILGPDSDDFQVLIPIGTGSTTSSARTGAQPEVQTAKPARTDRRLHAVRPATGCLVTNPACAATL